VERLDKSVPLEEQRRIDEICQDFEDQWIANRSPAIAAFLARLPASSQQSLLRELLPIDVHYRAQAGLTADAEYYLEQLAEFGPAAQQVVRQYEQAEREKEATPGAGTSQLQDSQFGFRATAARLTTRAQTSDAAHAYPAEIGPYRLLDEIGRGGMGVVYRARHAESKQLVAIKLLTPAADVGTKGVQLFLRETSMLSRLRHRHIVSLLESGLVEGTPYFVMEYVPTFPYVAWLQKQQPAKRVRTAVAIVCRVLDALDYAHSQGIVHRDVKPSNILAQRTGATFSVKLADFGLAKEFQEAGLSTLTAEGEIRGTLQFMPPEQLRNAKLSTPACDVYSATACLYFLLAGEVPIPLSNDARAFSTLLREKPVPLRQRAEFVPAPLCQIIDSTLANEPSQRPACGELRKRLAPYNRKSAQST
jgi:serine/threonine protein kinase